MSLTPGLRTGSSAIGPLRSSFPSSFMMIFQDGRSVGKGTDPPNNVHSPDDTCRQEGRFRVEPRKSTAVCDHGAI